MYILDDLIHHHLSFYTFFIILFVVYLISPAVWQNFINLRWFIIIIIIILYFVLGNF